MTNLLNIDLPDTTKLNDFTNIKINEGLDINKNLAFYDNKQKIEVMKDIKVIDLKSDINKIIKLSDLI